ncbi:hypothetical protein BCR39DRAFT_500213 [Naematelia encephala]|uniref:Uncharacterized protein n=1 Tax=Naematelia encephala TaxID=71784 RepID=A0A1Y2AP47_9TREE|nr:hypothetical protein BCR39DRAFT_500213 [Naematelia encephala]
MPGANNYTIDDAQWATSALQLSSGWNMLRLNGSNQYINPDQVAEMKPLLSNFWNDSVSWTTQPGANTTLSFVGSEIWAYGIAGPDQGAYSVTLNNVTVGNFSAEADTVDYHHLLFATHGLDDGPMHYLTLTNEGQTSLAFDMAYITSQAFFGQPPASSLLTLSAPSTPGLASATPGQLSSPSNASAAAALLPTQYTAAQLASLTEQYHFHWNGAAYFIIVFASLITAVVMVLVVRVIRQDWLGLTKHNAQSRRRSVNDGESYLVSEGNRRERPTTRVLEALKGKQISHPMPSDDGHSIGDSQRTTSRGTGISGGEDAEDQVVQDW